MLRLLGTARVHATRSAVAPSSLRAFATISPLRILTPRVQDHDDWARQPLPAESDGPAFESEFVIPRPIRPANESVERKRARLVYLSRKRGILETDLLLSTFASKYLPHMDMEELVEYDTLLEENDWDIYYWATEARNPPERVMGFASKVMPLLIEHSKNRGRTILRMPDLTL
ncbi:Flavinator of succinate dehydrogenase-domain-containing protein [Cladochytrium replicatum]|nr:Flavinator of succinate dehydrogenase-domain-containing protein [Cladochytrium replicatum]